jgi:penicillin-binding protein 2
MKDSVKNQELRKRQYVIVLIVLAVAFIYIIQLFYIQIADSSYKENADNNAFLKKVIYPSRGLLYDRNQQLYVSNQPVYDLMIIMREIQGFDTLSFCNMLDITQQEFEEKMVEIKDKRKNRGYSRFTPQIFMSQLSVAEYGKIQEQLYKFRGVYAQQRVLRKYATPHGAHAIGSVGEVNQKQIDADSYYSRGDYKGQSGVEKEYELYLRGEKGVEILLRDAHGRIQGVYKNGERNIAPVAGKNLTMSIDMVLQEYGELLMNKKLGSVVAIEPATGEILALVSSPSYDPHLLVGRERSKNYNALLKDPYKPLFDRPLMAMYPPGSTFKLVNGLIYQQEGIINEDTRYPCSMGYYYSRTRKLGCHPHPNNLDLRASVQHSCNAYYCHGLKGLLDNAPNGLSTGESYDHWRTHVLSMGFGKKLGVDFPNEKAGLILESSRYDRIYGKNRWKSSTIISIAIGQGEILATPIQTANLAALIANRGYFYTPHIIKAIEGDSIDKRFREKHQTTVDEKYYDPIIDGMLMAVNQGTGRVGKIDGIDICGKTGTAQNPHGKDHSIFIAFAPKDNPKIAIAVYVENSGFGATWAVPIASLMIEKYLTGTIDTTKINRKNLQKRMLETSLIE